MNSSNKLVDEQTGAALICWLTGKSILQEVESYASSIHSLNHHSIHPSIHPVQHSFIHSFVWAVPKQRDIHTCLKCWVPGDQGAQEGTPEAVPARNQDGQTRSQKGPSAAPGDPLLGKWALPSIKDDDDDDDDCYTLPVMMTRCP